MAVVTVTGGSGQPAVKLTFDAGRTASEARSLGYMVSQQFASAPATYVDAAHNVAGEFSQSATSGQGYAVIKAPTTDYVSGFEAVTVTTAATVFGGASDGQAVLSQGNLTYGTTFGGGTVVLGGTDNTVGLYASGNTVYGGNGSDTINVTPNGNSPAYTGRNVIYAGDGATRVNMTGGAGVVSVTGSAESAAATLFVDAANSASYVDGGFGTLSENNAGGTVFGGSAGNNVIIGSNSAPVTITGGGTNDYLEGNSAGTVITAADDGSMVNVHNGNETIFGGYGTTAINVGASAGVQAPNSPPETLLIYGGDGASTISVGNDNHANISFTAGAGDVNYYGSSVDGTTAVLRAGSGKDFIAAGSGNTTLIAGTGVSLLNVGAGSDSIVGSTADNVFGFTTEAAGQKYYIDNFHVGDSIYVADQATVNYVLQNQTISNGTLTVAFQNQATITLSNTPALLTANDVKHL